MKFIKLKGNIVTIVDVDGNVRFAFSSEHVVTIEPAMTVKNELDLRLTFVNGERKTFFGETAKELMNALLGWQ